MTELEYYKPENFFIKNQAYQNYKDKFDHILMLFNRSEDLKKELSKVKLTSNEHFACSLIFLRSQEFIISILKLCNEGNAEDARIITRSLFEHYVHFKFIKKKNLGGKFIRFYWVRIKSFLEDYEHESPNSSLSGTREYMDFKANVFYHYSKVKNDYKRGGSWFRKIVLKIKRQYFRQNWSPKKLSKMAKIVKDKKIRKFVMTNYSSYVHCDIFGMSKFIKEYGENIIFDNSPKPENMDDILGLTSAFFGGIVAHLTELFGLKVVEDFEPYLPGTDNQLIKKKMSK